MTNTTPQDNDFHNRYRPRVLERLIGNEQATTRIKGMVESGKLRSSMLFTGPTGVGKTTLARAFAVSVNGKPLPDQKRSGTYREVNVGANRSIEEMRDLIGTSKFKPQGGKKRIIVLDEAQALLGNKPAVDALLKPLEDGSGDTIWILCSMEPDKFKTTEGGRAILGRVAQFVLKPHTAEDKQKYAQRIIKGESMDYVPEELVTTIVGGSDHLRDVANQLQAVGDYYAGMKTKPKVLRGDALSEVLASLTSSDEVLCAKIAAAALSFDYEAVHKACLDLDDHFAAVNKLMWIAMFLLSVNVVGKHKKIWWSPANRLAHTALKTTKVSLGQYAAFQEACVNLKAQMMTFSADPTALISSRMYRFIVDNRPKKTA